MESQCSEQATETQDLVLELPENGIIAFNSISICRLCANPNEKVIGIYSEEGVSNDLANKMNLYLPVKVSESDTLPLQCCWGCASTVLAWHDLVLASVEADRRLRSIEIVPEKHENVTYIEEVAAEEQNASRWVKMHSVINLWVIQSVLKKCFGFVGILQKGQIHSFSELWDKYDWVSTENNTLSYIRKELIIIKCIKLPIF